MHLVNCEECSRKELVLQEYLEAWRHIWKVGDAIYRNLQNDDHDVPPIYGLRRGFEEQKGENTKGSHDNHVGSDSVASYNCKISHILSMFLKPFKKLAELPCDVTEDLLYRIRECNAFHNLNECMVGVFHIKNNHNALDDSTRVDIFVERCLEVIMHSRIEFENVDVKEVGLYLAMHLNPNLLKGKHLSDFCPTRSGNEKQALVGVTCLEGNGEQENRWIGWCTSLKEPDYLTARRMVITALDHVLKHTLKHHACAVNKMFHKHMRATGVAKDISHLYKVWWDRELKKGLTKEEMSVKMYVRYGDVGNIVVKTIPNNNVKDDKYTMHKVKEIAKGIDDNITIRVDYPSNNPNNRIVILDTEQWIEEVSMENDKREQVIHSHYGKAISSKEFVHVSSEMPYIMKMNALTNDLVRVMRNVSVLCTNAERISKVQEYLKKLQTYGYSKAERINIYKRAKNRYDKLLVDEEELDLYQSKFWHQKKKREEKAKKKQIWHHHSDETTYFEEAEKIQTLANKRYEKIMKTYGYPVKVVEDCTESLRNELVRSNPFRATKCEGEKCRVCSNVRIKSIEP